jgi:hypothetical protein
VHKLEAKEVTKLILDPASSLVTLTVKRNAPDAKPHRVTSTRAPAPSALLVIPAAATCVHATVGPRFFLPLTLPLPNLFVSFFNLHLT